MAPEFCNWKAGFALHGCYNVMTVNRQRRPVVQTRNYTAPYIKGVTSKTVDGSSNLKWKACLSTEITIQFLPLFAMRKTCHCNKTTTMHNAVAS